MGWWDLQRRRRASSKFWLGRSSEAYSRGSTAVYHTCVTAWSVLAFCSYLRIGSRPRGEHCVRAHPSPTHCNPSVLCVPHKQATRESLTSCKFLWRPPAHTHRNSVILHSLTLSLDCNWGSLGRRPELFGRLSSDVFQPCPKPKPPHKISSSIFFYLSNFEQPRISSHVRT